MTRTFRICGAITKTGCLELIRRKDLYVIGVLMLVMLVSSATFGFFGVRGISTFIRDVTFSAIGIFSTILTVLISSRQIGEEFSRKTIYPILARPITRWEYVIAKWFAAWTMSSSAFLALVAIGMGGLLAFSVPVGAIVGQYVVLKIIGLAWLSAVTIALSFWMTPSAAATIALIIAIGSAAFGRTVLLMNADHPMSHLLLNFLYAILPHYDYFDLGSKVTYLWAPIPWWAIGVLFAYAVLNASVWLAFGWFKFRRQRI